MLNRCENQMNKSQYLQPNVSYQASQASEIKKKNKQQKGVQRAGSLGGLLNEEKIPSGDQDSGIVDAYSNVPDNRNVRQRTKVKKVTLHVHHSGGKTMLLKKEFPCYKAEYLIYFETYNLHVVAVKLFVQTSQCVANPFRRNASATYGFFE